MSYSLIPKRLSNRLLNSPLARFPNLWDDFAEEFKELASDQYDIDIYEDENNALHIDVPMPGLKAENIEVNLNRGILWIKGEQKEEERDKSKKFYRKSRRTYSFQIPVPVQTDEKQEPKAEYKEGIVKISLQKAKQEESKRITVKS